MKNAKTGNDYEGRNATILEAMPYTSENWATFLQWRELGRKVKKGAKGTPIVRMIEITKTDKKTKKVESGNVPMYYHVFNEEQTEAVEK